MKFRLRSQSPLASILLAFLVFLFCLILLVLYGDLVMEILDVDLRDSLSYSVSPVEIGILTNQTSTFKQGEGEFILRFYQKRDGGVIPVEDILIGIGYGTQLSYFDSRDFTIEYITGEDDGYFRPGETIEIQMVTPLTFVEDQRGIIGIREKAEDSELLLPLEFPPYIRKGYQILY